ncbi:MAG: hypothetical protein KA170_00055 [Candidatus Promineofilum sp.]|nr:hypothetical protein [Promineifilum sp.]
MDTIKRGFSLTWNNKFMWLLGFLAALGSGTAFSNSNYSANSNDMAGMADWMTPERMAALSAGLIAFSCVAVILGIILWLVALSARGGLVAGAAQLDRGQGKPTFRSAFSRGWRKIGRLVGMTITLYAVPAILFIVLVVGFIVVAGGAAIMASGMDNPSSLGAGIGGLALVFLCLLCLLLPFWLALSLIYPFAFRGIILRDLGVMDSIRHGWRTLKENLGEIILLGLAFFLINIVILIIAAAILVPIGLAVGVPLAMLSGPGSNATAVQGILAVLGIAVGLVVFALISAISTAWQSSTFTLAYLEWTGKDVIVE